MNERELIQNEIVELNQLDAIKKEQIEEFNWGKFSFILGVLSVVLVIVFWSSLLSISKNTYGETIKDIKLVSAIYALAICLFAVPIITGINIICVTAHGMQGCFKKYKHKYMVLSGFTMSLIATIFYIYHFI